MLRWGVTVPKGSAALERGITARLLTEGGLVFEQNKERQVMRIGD